MSDTLINLIKSIWSILTPLDKRKLSYVAIIVILMTFIESMGVISIMPFLAALASPVSIHNNVLLNNIYIFLNVNNDKDFIVVLGLISLGIVVFSAAFKILTQYYLNRFANLQRHYFSSRLLKIYLKQNYNFFINRNSSDLTKKILADVDQVIWGIIQPLLTVVSYSLVLMAMVALIVLYDPIMAFTIALVLLLFYISMYLLIRQFMARISKEFSKASHERYQSCQEVFGGIKDVMINNVQNFYFERFDNNSRIYARHLASQSLLGQIPLHIIETIGYGCLILLAIFLVLDNQHITDILPIIGLYGVAAYRMLPAAQNIFRSVNSIKFSMHILNEVVDEFKLDEKIEKSKKNPARLIFKKRIRLVDVSFAYQGDQSKLVLNHFNLELEKNSSLGIVGKSGSGKSTLMDVMLGLLKPISGSIWIDDVQITDDNVHDWQSIVSYVPQFIYLADTTIAENIAFGINKAEIDHDLVRKSAELAQINEFIETELPNGYDTRIGERGVLLSGGQRQRIGIARALYKQPQVLFMDEATSALDNETEQAVNNAIAQLNGKITIVTIAHRESVINKCNSKVELK
ncbi:ABC transporter ATP-binding protein [Acinetobacter variabilis]|uniref:ABC transporter ATP-binding protein n=1 Tax=Acinetobacter variabilis TaxID=70346 RepID=UPI00289DB237|nr:ATP-binding cassette domain-containing protein [Acinetobacter variabilis]